jgi:hypothetical protein
MIDKTLQTWLDNKDYLHHYFKQEKDIFGIFDAIYQSMVPATSNTYEMSFGPNGQLQPEVALDLVMNFLFPFLARHGYVLGRPRVKINFEDKSPENQKKVMRWRENQGSLPAFLKEFDRQKLFMKTFAHYDGAAFFDKYPEVSWIDALCYFLDYFLWRLARFGLVLRKSQKKLEFMDMNVVMDEFDDLMRESFYRILKTELDKNQTEKT